MPTRTKILVTGAAGFIGFHFCRRLLESQQDYEIVGVDNLNNYYDVSLKEERLRLLQAYPKFTFFRCDLGDKEAVDRLLDENEFTYIVHLAAQAGVRYSIENPGAYIQSNIIGYFNIVEAIRAHKDSVRHFVFASSSSVYGANKKIPFAETDKTDSPVSLYAATKKADEEIGYAYAHLYGIPTTGLRFFTVYGPLGRPDMAYFSFALKMIKGEPIALFNYGDMRRDFTYVDDIVEAIERLLPKAPSSSSAQCPFEIFNIGNNSPVSLGSFVDILSNSLLKYGLISAPAEKKFLPMQPGDVYETYASIDALNARISFAPSTSLKDGLDRFAHWLKDYLADGNDVRI